MAKRRRENSRRKSEYEIAKYQTFSTQIHSTQSNTGYVRILCLFKFSFALIRWGKKVKKGKGVKKGKKGKKKLMDKGHKNTGFKTVYHKEEWGKSSKVR